MVKHSISDIKPVELIMQLQYTGIHEKPLSNLGYKNQTTKLYTCRMCNVHAYT